jgi:hypothetical protein
MTDRATEASRKAGALILRNLKTFNDAALLMGGSMYVELVREVNQSVKNWTEQAGWMGEYDWDNNNLWVSPAEWQIGGEKGQYLARFELLAEADDTESYEVADLCGCGQSRYGFRFSPNYGALGGKSKWNVFSKSLPAVASRLSTELGFLDEGKGVWFVPVLMDAAALASAYENEDYSVALAPLAQALDKIKAAMPVFDKILRKANSAT